MNYNTRKLLYRQLEEVRDTKVITYVTGERLGATGAVSVDCIYYLVEILDKIGPTKKISLILHTLGGDTAAAWRIVNLIKMYCENFEVIIPHNALSAGTLISLGANNIVMTKQAVLSPIDPSVGHPLGPIINDGKQTRLEHLSVEDFNGYFEIVKDDLKITNQEILGQLLGDFSKQVHPLVIGRICRARSQIRYLANELLKNHINEECREKLISLLCSDFGSHDYTINRREALNIGLPIEKPDDSNYKIINDIFKSVLHQMKFTEIFDPNQFINQEGVHKFGANIALIECTGSKAFEYVQEWASVNIEQNGELKVNNYKLFDGWRPYEIET